MVDTMFAADEIQKVRVEAAPNGRTSEVWLAKNIAKDTADKGPDGEPVEFWRADYIRFIVPGIPLAADVEAEFDALWSAHEYDGMGASERMAQLEQQVAETQAAVIELGDIVGGE